MKTTLLSILIAGTPLSVASQAIIPETITVWVAAYIPDDTDNEFIWDHASGATVVADPFGIACYTTDERGPSDDPDASARIFGLVETEIVSGPPWFDIEETIASVGETTGYGCATTEVECVDTAEMDEEEIDATRVGNLFTATFDLAAGNPCSLLASNFGAIDIEIRITINLLSGEFEFEGNIAEFPNYEMYLQYDDNAPVSVFSYEIEDDSSPESLIGEADFEISGSGNIF